MWGPVNTMPCLPDLLLEALDFHHLPIGDIHLWKSSDHLSLQLTQEVACKALEALIQVFHTNNYEGGEAPHSSQTPHCCLFSKENVSSTMINLLEQRKS